MQGLWGTLCTQTDMPNNGVPDRRYLTMGDLTCPKDKKTYIVGVHEYDLILG